MKNFFSFLTFASICSIAYTEIQPAANLEPIYKEVERSSEETLLFLDVGGTLLIHKDPVLHVTHESWKHLWFQKHYPSITLQEKIALVRIVEANETSWALADTWPDLIKKAQARKLKVAALTKVVMDPALEKIRIARLKRFGLTFQEDLRGLTSQPPLFSYTQGVIETGEKLKGPVVDEVLKRLDSLPQKIIVVDDRLEQLQSIEEVCQRHRIPFVGFHYIAFAKSPYLDEAVAHKQLETLVKEHRWIPSEDVSLQ